MNKETLGTMLAVLTAVFSGIAIPANKVFVVNTDPAVFTAVRAIVIGIIFLLLSLLQRNRQKIKARFTVSWKYLAAIAIIGGSFAFLLFFTGLSLTTASRGAFLHKTLPIYVAILAYIFLKEKITRKHIGAIVLMLAGTVAIYATSINPAELWSNPQMGDLLIIGATIMWAAENVIARKAMIKGETNFIVSFARMFFGGLILFGVVLLTGKFDALLALSTQQMANISISIILLFCYVFFYYWSLRLINVSKAATMLLLAPVVSLILGVTFLSEPAPALQLFGSAVILIGAYIIVGIRSEQRAI
jgi:drug/metabolite transporter (DMT)-like permease